MTENASTMDRVKNVVGTVFKTDTQALTEDTLFVEDLRAKSMNTIELAAMLENEFGVAGLVQRAAQVQDGRRSHGVDGGAARRLLGQDSEGDGVLSVVRYANQYVGAAGLRDDAFGMTVEDDVRLPTLAFPDLDLMQLDTALPGRVQRLEHGLLRCEALGVEADRARVTSGSALLGCGERLVQEHLAAGLYRLRHALDRDDVGSYSDQGDSRWFGRLWRYPRSVARRRGCHVRPLRGELARTPTIGVSSS